MRALLTRLRSCDRGVSAMEFALILPILVMFSAGTIEYSRMIILTQKLQSGAFMLADLTARDKTLVDRPARGHLPRHRPGDPALRVRRAAATRS